MRKAHYLEPLKSDRTPRYNIVFDCETQLRDRAGRQAHYWACGATCEVARWGLGEWVAYSPQAMETPEELWSYVAQTQREVGRLVVWAHNLTFDLRVSEALRYLPLGGYTLEAIVLERTAAWASFTSEHGTLTLCDLYSWLPVSLEKLAADMGRGRERINYALADVQELQRHCCNDVALTGEIVRTMLQYLDENRAGPFRPTGSGQSHAFWRRNHLPAKTVLVHEDAYALERERTAMWAGRAEAWRWGEIDGPLYEYDLNLAYCRIAAECEVPVKLLHRSGPLHNVVDIGQAAGRAHLSDVMVTTHEPIVPTGEGRRVYWPVGTFHTTLWDPEIKLLKAAGAAVYIARCWVYETAPVLSPMATWLIDQLRPDNETVPAPMKRMLKHWARTLVGRCGLRYRQWEEFGSVPQMGLSLSLMYDLDTEETTELLHVGERIMELSAMAEADSSVPQITGWVMSEARRRLWQLIQVAGPQNVIYMDTDSLIVNCDGRDALDSSRAWPTTVNLAHKAVWSAATIRGPRDMELEGKRRIAGVPVKAIRIGELTYDGEVWAGVKASLSGKQLDNVAVTRRLFEVTASDSRRIHLPGGTTRPHEVNYGTTD